MSLVEAGTPSLAGSDADVPPSGDTMHGSNSVRDRTLKDIISGMKKRRGAKPMPSTVQRAKDRRKRRRREAQGLPPEEVVESAPQKEAADTQKPAEGENDDGDGDDDEDAEDDVVAPQVTIDEDGNIVIDQSSLVVSAGTAANAEADRAAVTVENHAFSNHITSATYSKRELALKWEEAETDRFYSALRKFGTDFSLMESSFPNRSRRQLKLKFKREEKEFPERIDGALNGPPLPLPPLVKSIPPKDAESGTNERDTAEKDGNDAVKMDNSDSDDSGDDKVTKHAQEAGSHSDNSD